MRMQVFRVKKPSCKIQKTKHCVPFEVQYTPVVHVLLFVLEIFFFFKKKALKMTSQLAIFKAFLSHRP